MNNNIRNFAKESHLDLYGLGLDRAKWEAAMEKFAELIVRECASRVDNILREKKDGGGTMGDEIREHFGVEE